MLEMLPRRVGGTNSAAGTGYGLNQCVCEKCQLYITRRLTMSTSNVRNPIIIRLPYFLMQNHNSNA